MAQGALAFDDDHVRLFVVERLDDGGFQFAGAKLRGHRIQCHTVAGALDQSGLAGTHQHRLEADGIESGGEHGGGGAFADGAVGTQHGDARAGDLMDAAAEHAQKFLRPGPAHIDDIHFVGNAGGGEFRVVVKEFMQTVNDAHALAHGGQHYIALDFGEQAAGRCHTENQKIRQGGGLAQGVIHIPAYRDAVGGAVQNHAGIKPGLGAVDH